MNELKKIISQKGLKMRFIADQLGMSYISLNDRINGRTEWKAKELLRLKKMLKLTDDQCIHIFLPDV